MKAIVCQKYKGADGLALLDVPLPEVKADEVLVKVHSSTATTGDWRIMSFSFASWFWLPARLLFGIFGPRKQIPGWEVAGIVERSGKKVDRFKIGDTVFGYTKGVGFGGTNAEFVALGQDRLVALQGRKIRFEEAVVLPIGGLSAVYFLRKGEVNHGTRVLINGASGSVGSFAVQLAKIKGATVTAVCSPHNFELIKSLGADHLIDYTTEDFTKQKSSYDVILDAVGKTSFHQCKNALTPKGRFVTVEWPFLDALVARLFSSKSVQFGMAPHSLEDLEYLVGLVEHKKLVPIISQTFTLSEGKAAYQLIATGHKQGNVVINVLSGN